MHLIRPSALLIAGCLLAAVPVAAQQPAQQQPQQQTQQQTQQQPQPQAPLAQPDPQAQQPESKPIAPQAQPQQKPAPKRDANAPRNRTMQFDLPPLVPIAEIPRGKAVMIQGIVHSPQPTTFVLNDGNASMVINLGATWQELTKVKAGDRVRVIGQMDPYGASVFRAGSIVLENNRIIVVPNS
ncbi:hypothetical protein [uncultured Ferrovibrio sp.]|jgi:uncharacterized protein YdeI (BOF family)|uniref:hypothetical protein n=1 Tax=uncultured Ferrovibrio sp. TaxID=1576913 RepID=UPI0026312697|nr:hypothetical protein [uncultured Ferrovibrio sp.]